MWREHHQLIYRPDMTRCGVYWWRWRFTGWILSRWKLVHWRLGESVSTEGGVCVASPREGEQSVQVTTSYVHTISSSLWRHCVASISPHVCSTRYLSYPLTSSLLTEAAVFPRGFVPVLRWPLQAVQWLLCQPHQGPEGPGERYYISLTIYNTCWP